MFSGSYAHIIYVHIYVIYINGGSRIKANVNLKEEGLELIRLYEFYQNLYGIHIKTYKVMKVHLLFLKKKM